MLFKLEPLCYDLKIRKNIEIITYNQIRTMVLLF